MLSTPTAMFPTPTVNGNNNQKGSSAKSGNGLATAVKLFPTPSTQEVEHPDAVLTESGRRVTKSGESSHSLGLADTVRLFPTPAARDSKGANSMEHLLRDGRRNHTDQLANAVKLFATPQARDYRTGQAERWENPERSRNLNDEIAMFPTPTPTERKSAGSGEKYITSTGTIRRKNADGTISNMGLSATVTSEDQLNPDWVEWLMGFPFGWTDPEREVDKSTMSGTGHWLPEPNIPRVAAGAKNRVNRLKCLGNAVVPQQFYPVFRAIAEIEKEMEK